MKLVADKKESAQTTSDSGKDKLDYRIPLSPYAKVFYDEWLIDSQNYRYNIVISDHLLTGFLNVQRLQAALTRYITDHLLLNSHIQLTGMTPCWVRNKHIGRLHYSETPISEKDLLQFVVQPFDLAHGNLYRFKLIKVSEATHRFIVVFHHLVMDGISIHDGLFERLSLYYNSPTYTNPVTLNQQIDQITSFQKKCSLELGRNKCNLQRFWKTQLLNLEPLDLRFLSNSKICEDSSLNYTDNHIKEIHFNLSRQGLKNDLDKIKLRHQLSPYFFSQCIFAMALYRYTQQENFAICYPVTIRPGIDFEFGAQVNLTLMPYRFKQDMRPCDLLQQIHKRLKEIKNFEMKGFYYPISNLIEDNQCKSLLTGYFSETLFRDEKFKFEGIESVKPLSILHVDQATPEMFLIEKDPSQLASYRTKYDSRTIDKDLLKGFIDCYKKLFLEVLDDLLQENHKPITSYQLLTEKQSQSILTLCKAPLLKQQSGQLTVPELFEKKAQECSQNIAISYQNRTLSYQLLNEKANQLAHYLRKKYHIRADERILLCLEKDEWSVIAILAVLKSSGAYVPIGGDYPEERIAYMLDDTQAKCTLISKKYSHKFKNNPNVIVLDEPKFQKDLSNQPTSNLRRTSSENHLAYIIYTSGTTGKPKGVLQQHNNIIDLFHGTDPIYCFHDRDVWTLFHNYVFDFSVWEIFGALFYGGKLVIPTFEETRDPELFYNLCYKEKVTVLNQTPTAFYQLIQVAQKNQHNSYLSELRYIILGGESLNYAILSEWFSLYSDSQPCIINMYGITETTIHVTYKKVSQSDCAMARAGSPIGKPFPGREVYVLNKQLDPVPIGGLGEFYCKGGVARGYLNQTKLTKKHFISNPFSQDEHSDLLYQSGDLGRMLPDGSLEHLGRIDNQVKIHGYRIETGEIESILKTYPSISWTLVHVISKDSTNSTNCIQAESKHLVAYFMASKNIPSLNLRKYLANRLPDFMCPNIFIQISKIPTTTNGKLDLNLLPSPQSQLIGQSTLPENEQEKIICNAFCEVLNLDTVGVDNDFFDELGGSSIDAVHLTLVLEKYFDIQVADIFTLRTPRNIAKGRTIRKGLLAGRLEEVKSLFKKKALLSDSDRQLQEKKERYLAQVKIMKPYEFSIKPIKTVLLTGATGYLGCNILYQLLTSTSYTIYLLVRGTSAEEAMKRVNDKFTFYFNQSIYRYNSSRIRCFPSNLEENRLELDEYNYKTLVSNVDSIIHAAALVKHYGDEGDFYASNVKATEHLLQLASLTSLKDFHYISTCSVAYFGRLAFGQSRFFTEDDIISPEQGYDNIYNKTKCIGEQSTIAWRKQGVKGTIYRVGNLALMSHNSKTQKNIDENSFANWLKFILKIQCLPQEMSTVQLSQTDLVAKAITLLFNKEQLSNQVFHLFNAYPISLLDFFKRSQINVQRVSIDTFIDNLVDYLKAEPNCILSELFLLHQGWIGHDYIFDKYSIDIAHNKSDTILNQLGFQWPRLSNRCLEKYINYLN